MIIIKKQFNELWLYSVTHTPINLTPFTNPKAIEDFCYYMRVGKIKKLFNFQIDIEYDLDCWEDFVIIERERKIFGSGSSFDELTLIPKSYLTIYLRKDKLEKINDNT